MSNFLPYQLISNNINHYVIFCRHIKGEKNYEGEQQNIPSKHKTVLVNIIIQNNTIIFLTMQVVNSDSIAVVAGKNEEL